MNLLFIILVIVSLITAFIQGNVFALTEAVMKSGESAVTYILTVGAVIIVYSGIMNVANKAGLCDIFAKLLGPAISRLFGNVDEKVSKDITMNISCNLLGLGNAATPYGISAMKGMAKGDTATKEMILFTVINTSSVQLIPATVASVRQSAGSMTPFDILPCVWLTSVVCLTVSILCCKLCERIDMLLAKRNTSVSHSYNGRVGSSQKG